MLPPVCVPLAAAGGATLAEPLRALVALPGYDAAAMDGYAVAGAGPWRVTGRVLAGQRQSSETLPPGSAVEIATGAAVPSGTAAILPYEQATREGELVRGTIAGGRHVRSWNEVCAADEELLPAGAALTPAALGLAASVGHDELPVRQPSVTALVTGDEVVDSGLPGPSHVRDALGPLLPGVIRAAGGEPTRVNRVSDRRDALRAAIEQEEGADVVVCCGASSAGPADYLRPALQELDAEVWIDGVACRPGHPQLLGRLPGGRIAVGLPGNPYAALVAAMTLLVPVLHALAGRLAGTTAYAEILPDPVDREERVTAHPRDTRLVAVRRSTAGAAVPVGHQRPGGLRGAAVADALAVIPPGWSGGAVELMPIPGTCP